MAHVFLRLISSPLLLLLVCLAALPPGARAAQEYRYVEAEEHSATGESGVRNDGFTSWMRHPSHGRVMVLFGKGFLEYQVKGLGEGPYHLFVRGLAFASGADVDLFWDGEKVGRTSYEVPATALKWSREIGIVRGPGDHVLRIANEPANHQAPYLDTILLTTQAGYHPSNEEADFASFTTPLPLLFLGTPAGETGILPDPKAQSDAGAPVDVAAIRAGGLGVGRNEIRLDLKNPAATARSLDVALRLGNGEEGRVPVTVPAGASATAAVSIEVVSPGAAALSILVREKGKVLVGGSYRVRVPDPVKVSLDEYAFPVGTERVTWRAAFSSRPEVTREVEIVVSLRRAGDPRVIESRRLAPNEQGAEATLPLRGLPAGRYSVAADLRRRERLMTREERELFLFIPSPQTPWEPVKRTEAKGDVVFMNGKPFLPVMLYHAGIDANTQSHGYNLVQCFGADPDPTASIQDHLFRCVDSGLWGTVALFNNSYFLKGDHFDLEHIRDAVLRFKDHPALLCWDLIDEPDGANVPPERVAEAARLIRELDPHHLVWVNLCQPTRATDYLESQDVWSFDAYPIPTQGVFGYLPWLKITDEKIRGKRPMGTCLQTYAYPDIRMPTPDELRASWILHVIHGYKWFGYYSYHDPEPYGCLARDPALWSYTRALNSEMRALAPVILDPAPVEIVKADVHPSQFEAGGKRTAAGYALFAVSDTKETIRVRMQVAGSTAKVLFEEERVIPIRDGVLEDTFAPGRSRVYQIR